MHKFLCSALVTTCLFGLAFADGGKQEEGRGWGPRMGMMMGGGMGMCPIMAPDTKVEVKTIKNGVIITLTSEKSENAIRLQKMAEGMKLMHEAMETK